MAPVPSFPQLSHGSSKRPTHPEQFYPERQKRGASSHSHCTRSYEARFVHFVEGERGRKLLSYYTVLALRQGFVIEPTLALYSLSPAFTSCGAGIRGVRHRTQLRQKR